MMIVEDVRGSSYQAPEIWEEFLTPWMRPLTDQELSSFKNRRILITGAGGYLGSALASALAELEGVHLVLLDHAEYGLYKIEQDFKDSGREVKRTTLVGSVSNCALIEEIFQQHAPEIVFHTAALKHVPLMQENVFAAAETNALGTQVLVQAAVAAQTKRLVLLSTDKVVQPISVMGVTKRIAEQILLRAHMQDPGRFLAVRLCNVLGSTGSVAPLFVRQLLEGRPLTLTHDVATRFFLSRQDAVRCLLRAALMPTQTGVVVPKLHAAKRVRDLADFLKKRYTGAPGNSEIIVTGLREGDKLQEELVAPSESVHVSPDPQLLSVGTQIDAAQLGSALAAMASAVQTRDRELLWQALAIAVPEYQRQSWERTSVIEGQA